MGIEETVRYALLGREVREIGKSVLGRSILAAHAGPHTGDQIIITAGMHARECYTALVVLEQLARFDGGGGAWLVPLVNPDGAAFFESGLYGAPNAMGAPVLKSNLSDAVMWKANAQGVDLNTNFDARWGTGKQNKRVPGKSDHIGEYPLCAPESAALARFSLEVRPAMTVSYHCMGGELYWEFFQTGKAKERDGRIAAAVAQAIGVKKVDGDNFSAGGYKDWCIQTLSIPALTIELIKSGSHPFLPEAYAPDIRANAHLPQLITQLLSRG